MPNSTCGKLCTHEAVHVSEDLKHDAHLVKKFNEKTGSLERKKDHYS